MHVCLGLGASPLYRVVAEFAEVLCNRLQCKAMSRAPIVGVRVGELARRVGVAQEPRRAWERRYGVLRPSRTPGGYRVYGAEDELRAQRMRELVESGLAAGGAAPAVRAAEAGAN